MNIEELKNKLPAYAKDIRLNLSTVLSDEEPHVLTLKQRYSIALACAYSTKNNELIKALSELSSQYLSVTEIEAAKSAAIIMSMNNIYYRFIHLVSDKSYATMPAKLRMTIISNPGIDKIDFEMSCLAVSALNGCGMCMDAHVKELINSGTSKEAVQAVVRVAAVLNAAATAIELN